MHTYSRLARDMSNMVLDRLAVTELTIAGIAESREKSGQCRDHILLNVCNSQILKTEQAKLCFSDQLEIYLGTIIFLGGHHIHIYIYEPQTNFL